MDGTEGRITQSRIFFIHIESGCGRGREEWATGSKMIPDDPKDDPK